MKLAVFLVNRLPEATGMKAIVSSQTVTEDIVGVAQETGIPLRMLNDMVSTWEKADSHPVVALERGLRWDPNLVYRVEVRPSREPDHEPYDATAAVELVARDA
jgi:hypothetical protein